MKLRRCTTLLVSRSAPIGVLAVLFLFGCAATVPEETGKAGKAVSMACFDARAASGLAWGDAPSLTNDRVTKIQVSATEGGVEVVVREIDSFHLPGGDLNANSAYGVFYDDHLFALHGFFDPGDFGLVVCSLELSCAAALDSGGAHEADGLIAVVPTGLADHCDEYGQPDPWVTDDSMYRWSLFDESGGSRKPHFFLTVNKAGPWGSHYEIDRMLIEVDSSHTQEVHVSIQNFRDYWP